MSHLPQDDAKPFLDHLEDLRHVIIRCAVVLGVAMIIAVPLAPQILTALKAPLVDIVEDPDRFLQSLQVAGAFTITLRIAFWTGLLISAPFLLYFIGGFIVPGLKSAEKRLVRNACGFALGLFVLGVALGYFVTMPVALGIMLGIHSWLGIEAMWTIGNYVSFTLQLMLGFGLAFQMPVIVLILGKLGILSATQLREGRRFVVVIVLVIAMALTPPDIFTQMIMAVPLLILYEICIWLLRATDKRNK